MKTTVFLYKPASAFVDITSFQMSYLLRQGFKSLDSSSTLNHLDRHYNEGDDQKGVNDSAQRVAADQSQRPQNQ